VIFRRRRRPSATAPVAAAPVPDAPHPPSDVLQTGADAADGPLVQVVLDALARAEEHRGTTGLLAERTTPVHLRPHHRRFAAEAALIDPDPGRGVTYRTRTHEHTLANTHRLPELIDRLAVNDTAALLLAGGRLTVDEVRTHLLTSPDLPAASGLGRQVVLTLRDSGDHEAAAAAADALGTWRWLGYRDLAARWADAGDATTFFAHWRDFRAGEARRDMVALKTRLVRGVVARAGWEAGVDLALGERRLGQTFVFPAIRAAAPTSPQDVAALLAGPAGDHLTELQHLDLLVAAVLRVTPHDPEQSQEHPMLREIVDRLIAIDPTVDRETMRARDALLFATWPAQADAETLADVRRAVRTPDLRAQLTRLPRDPRG
jgi:hypothetical protein